MPELPEVEFLRRQLRRVMEGERFVRVQVRRPDLRYPFPARFAARLQGTKVRTVTRRAKYLRLQLSSGDVLLIHLGMSGWFRVHREPSPALDVHDHVVFEMSSGRTVVFSDPRRFGFMKLIDVKGSDLTERLGPEPLDRAFTASVLAAALSRRTVTLKAALLDQRVVAGLGNIYVSEALHRARLLPMRSAAALVSRDDSSRPIDALVRAIKHTLRDAIAHHHRPGGDDRFLVYGREGERCRRRRCAGVIQRITQNGRSTFFCPACQQ